MKGIVFKSIVLVVSIMLVFVSGAYAYVPAVVIPPGPPNTLPDYIGAPAKAHPTANSGIPQNPYLAANPWNTIHVDPCMSDVYDIAGPLGHDPVVLTSRLEDARNNPNSKVFQCSGGVFDPYGNLLTNCSGDGEAGVILMDAKTLEVVDYYPLSPNTSGSSNAVSSVYWVYDSQGGFTVSGWWMPFGVSCVRRSGSRWVKSSPPSSRTGYLISFYRMAASSGCT